MFHIEMSEYKEGDNAVRTKTITLFGIVIYSSRETTTNNNIVSLLTAKKRTIIKGFKNED